MKREVHDWKAGTEALALCSLCGGEYAVDATECPECHVSLSIVRRCPECSRLVSAQHTRCVYCRAPFTNELPRHDAGPLPPMEVNWGQSAARRRLRATVVSVGTFVIVFTLGILFLRVLNKPNALLQTVARTHALAAARLRSSPSNNSSIAGMITTRTPLNITGVQQNSQGRWITVQWGGGEAYIPASEVNAPLIKSPGGGAEVLQFFLEGMDSADAVAGARQSVEQFAKAFPRSSEIDQLRWTLAERARVLSRRGGKQSETLQKLASEQYQRLADGNGPYAVKARAALQPQTARPTAKPARSKDRSPDRSQEAKTFGGNGIQVIGDTTDRRQALVIAGEDVFVHAGKISGTAAGSVVSGKTTRQIEENGIVAIPAGARCTLKVLNEASEGSPAKLELLSIEVDHRSYPVHSAAVEWQAGDRPLRFHLDSPLVIQR